MKRYAQDSALIARRARQWHTLSSSGSADSAQPGRFRKRKPLDCGRARCGLCHSEKLHHRPSHADKRAAEAAAHDLREAVQG